MNPKKTKKTLLALGLGLAVLGAVLGATEKRGRATLSPGSTLRLVAPMQVAALLAEGSPEVVVLTLGQPEHALDGALPAGAADATDEVIVAAAPRARRVVLAGKDQVRAERLARAMAATGREVSVLAGGLDAWDRAMAEDPPAPEAGASAETWARYRTDVALRRRFGEAGAQPAAVIAAPAAPTSAAAPARKREGC